MVAWAGLPKSHTSVRLWKMRSLTRTYPHGFIFMWLVFKWSEDKEKMQAQAPRKFLHRWMFGVLAGCYDSLCAKRHLENWQMQYLLKQTATSNSWSFWTHLSSTKNIFQKEKGAKVPFHNLWISQGLQGPVWGFHSALIIPEHHPGAALTSLVWRRDLCIFFP